MTGVALAPLGWGSASIDPDPDLFDSTRWRKPGAVAVTRSGVRHSDPWERHLVVIPRLPSESVAGSSISRAAAEPTPSASVTSTQRIAGVYRDSEGTLMTVQIDAQGQVTVAVEGDDEPPAIGRMTGSGGFAAVVSDDPAIPMRVTMDGRLQGDDLEVTIKMTGGPQAEEVLIKREVVRRVVTGGARR